jgi:hypothetical protein
MATRPLSREPRGDQKKTKIVERRKAEDWTKPQAMAIPKGAILPTRSSRADTVRSFPKLQLATASASSRRSSLEGKSTYTIMPR